MSDAPPGPDPHQDHPPAEADESPRAGLLSARRARARKNHVLGWPFAGLIVLGVCGLVMVGVTTSRVGLLPALIGALTGLLPVGIVFATIVWIDRWEPEPPLLMLGAFLWGVGGATASSLLFNHATEKVTTALLGPGDHSAPAVVVGPFFEEAAKALFVVALWFRRRSEFNGLVDGIVYAGLTAAGFAYVENILYFGKAFAQDGFGGVVLALLVMRAVLTPFSHPLFSAMFGFGIGMASRTRPRAGRLVWAVGGFAVAVALHAVWNYSANSTGARFVDMYFLIMVPVFAGMGWLVVWQRRREQRIVVVQLPALRREGLIDADEVELLASLGERRGWKRHVRRDAGREAAKAVRDYQIAVTELAFLQHRATRVRTTSAVRRARRQRLVEELREARRASAAGQRVLRNRSAPSEPVE